MEVLELDCLSAVYGGLCLCRKDGVVLLKGAIPGETVLAQITDKKRDYSLASTVNIIKQSKDRIQSKCSVFGLCGGCHLQHISYSAQIDIKKQVLLDCLKRIAKCGKTIDKVITKNQWNYRSKAQFKISAEGAIGFYKENSRDVVPIDECFIVKEEINSYLRKLKQIKLNKGIKELHILSGENNSLAYVIGDNVSDNFLDSLLTELGFDGVSSDKGIAKGQNRCAFTLPVNAKSNADSPRTLKFSLSPGSFFQSNWDMNVLLVDEIINSLTYELDGNIADIYGGAGNFTLPLALSASSLVLIEESPISINDAQENAKANNIKNVKFINKPFEKAKLTTSLFDAAVIDPPRKGLSSNAAAKLLELFPIKIVYVSCNPSTFARDSAKLMEKYELTTLTLADMFPNTYHMEIIGVFTQKK
ncbi:TrmA family RNA methyltransferase [Candidatus Magnetoovum chiemensis]|nr:TrmA family RNA methyltransferase [Candidatus Magnetoovum chiemensis]